MSKKFIISGAIVLAAVAGVAVYLYTQRPSAQAAAAQQPAFSFDSSHTTDWWSNGNSNPRDDIDPSTYDESLNGPIDSLPVSDLRVHHGGPGHATPADNCFVSASYYDHRLDDVAAAYSEYRQPTDKWGGTREQLGEISRTITTPEGEKSYQLLRYHFIQPGGSQEYLSGYQIGFANLAHGHLRIESVCKTPADLDLTLPILDRIQLHER